MLTGKQKRYLRGLANTEKAVIMIGKEGISDQLFNSIDNAFNTRELLKCSILKTCDVEMNELCIEVCANCHCELVQTIGKTIVLYKKAKEPKIVLPC